MTATWGMEVQAMVCVDGQAPHNSDKMNDNRWMYTELKECVMSSKGHLHLALAYEGSGSHVAAQTRYDG